MAYLVLIRHGESQWNALGKWTGWTDIDLSEKGVAEARTAGEKLKDIHFDAAYTSPLLRAKNTLHNILDVLGQKDIPITASKAISERNYGDYTGKNKWEIKKQVGDEQFLKIRRGWDVAIPNGESLKDVYDRVAPYYRQAIEKDIRAGKNILITAHGNSLRALIKLLENISDDQIPLLELKTGEVYVYTIDPSGKITDKQIY